MPIAEWENLISLITPEGQLDLNQVQPEGFFLTAKESADSGSDIRATSEGVPQGAGSILHRGFPDGYVVKLPIQYWVNPNNEPATSKTTPTAQEMDDTLMRHIRSILDGGGRLFYQPAGLPVRLLDRISNVAKAALTEADGLTGTVLTLASEYPYMIDFTQILTTLTAGAPTATLTNTGSAPFFPVFKVHGPFADFALANNTTGLQIAYDESLPGAVAVGPSDYIEIVTFANSVYLNGNGASRKAGILIVDSDFFTLEVGDNHLEITSAGTAPTVDVLWQAAWF